MVNIKRSKSLSYEINDNPLCLCEYYNKNNERVHMLMCCCNCDAVDSLCTNILCSCCSNSTVYSDNLSLYNQSIADMADRLRYPFFGGARKVNLDFILSIMIILTYTSIGSINFICSIITLVTIPFILYLRFFFLRLRKSKKPRILGIKDLTKQSQSFKNESNVQIAHFLTLNTLIYMLYLFNSTFYDEVKQAMTKIEKGFFNFALFTAIILHVYLHNTDPGFIKREPNSEETQAINYTDQNMSFCERCKIKRQEKTGHCTICKSCVHNRDHHCFWIDNCIGLYNHKFFVLYLLWLLILFAYSLSVIYKHLNSLECGVISSIKNKSCLFDVYYSQSSRGLLFLLFLQLVPLVLYLLMLNLQQFLFISIGKTQQDLYRISQKNYKFSLAGYIMENFRIRVLIKNWVNFFKFRKSLISYNNDHLI